jgi:hypothetical protein
LLLFVAFAAPAHAAGTLNVFVDNNEIALGSATTLAAHVETDGAFTGGRILFKYKPGDVDCAATPAEDGGNDANADQPATVPAGPGTTDIGGEGIQLDVGTWRICGWLVEDASGGVVAGAYTMVNVVPYRGSLSISVKRVKKTLQFTLSYSTSAAARLYAYVQRGGGCATSASKIPRAAVPLVPRGGRLIGSDGGLGKSVASSKLAAGRWRVCALLVSEDLGSAGPVSKTFAVPKRKPRAGHAAG